MIELLSVFDMAANRYMDPFAAPTIEFALRGFSEVCRTPEHQFSKFPEDYALYHVGTFDPELGTIEAEQPRKIAQASAYVSREGE